MRRLILAFAFCVAAAPAVAARIKDISVLRTARDSQLVGYGLVVGLQGSGDTLRNAPFTEQSVEAMLTHLGLDVHGDSLRNRNVASVIVTADLSAGVETATRLDVTVSALGDAPSLMGGTLLLTQLQAADGTVYASAQGAVSVTGFDAVGQGETLSQGVPTAGRIRSAIVGTSSRLRDELRSMPIEGPVMRRRSGSSMRLTLFREHSRERRLWVDSRRSIVSPRRISFARFHGRNWELRSTGYGRARRSRRADGTVVIGQDVQISTVAVAYGTLTVGLPAAASRNPPHSRTAGLRHADTGLVLNRGGPAIVGGSSLRARSWPEPDRRQAAGDPRSQASKPGRCRPIVIQ